jgi:hypothetical protein
MRKFIIGGIAAGVVLIGLTSAAPANKRPCEANIAPPPANWDLPVMSCKRDAVTQIDGHWVCKQHAKRAPKNGWTC